MDGWVDPDRHGWVHHPVGDPGWDALLARYGAERHHPLSRVFAAARANRCRTVIEENRYVDPDYRSEYSAFWSQRFEARPAFARRLHFFRRRIADEHLHQIPRSDPTYLGYSTVKPISPGRVGRTMLVPPSRLSRATLTVATDRVSLFGTPLQVTGVPFCEQDGEYLRCAHAAAWMCHYHAHLRGLVGRSLTAGLVELSPQVLHHERALPSPGLTLNQLQAVLASTGQPALFYGLSSMPRVEGVDNPQPKFNVDGTMKPPGRWDTRLFSVVCRYLNAGFPVLAATGNHAFVIVGWFREGNRIRFIACDDQWGPYETIASPFTDRRGPWQCFLVPLPPKVYLSGEMAESTGHFLIRAWGQSGGSAAWQQLAQALTNGHISLRTFLRSNVDYKRVVAEQDRGAEAQRALRLARLPISRGWWKHMTAPRGWRAGRPSARSSSSTPPRTTGIPDSMPSPCPE